MGEDILIRSGSKTNMHGRLCWNSLVTDARIDVNPPSRPIYRCREGAAAGS